MGRSRLAFVLPLGVVAAVFAGCGSGTGNPTTPTVATGTVSCAKVTGALTFSPPITGKGGLAETTTVVLKAGRCTTQGSNFSSVTGGTASATISTPSNSCTNLLTSKPLTVSIRWTPSTIRPSVLTLSGYGGVPNTSAAEFTFPGPQATAKVGGSFAGSDHGSHSTAKILSQQNPVELINDCRSSSGIPSLGVKSGTLALK